MTSRLDDRPTTSLPTGDRPRPSLAAKLFQLLPVLVFLATFGVFFVDKNREARTVFTSWRGFLTMAAIVVGYMGVAFVLRRFVRWAWVPPLVLSVVMLGLAAWIVRPYYVDKTANRQLVTGPVQDASQVPAAPPVAATETPPAPAPETAAAPVAPTPAPAATAPVRVSTGSLQGIGHDASGSASLIRNPDGTMIVRFETFDIEGAPDPRVYLVRGDDVQSPGGISLGGLEGNVGDVLDYEVPAGTDAGPGWTVLVWCRAFAVPIANATQAPA